MGTHFPKSSRRSPPTQPRGTLPVKPAIRVKPSHHKPSIAAAPKSFQQKILQITSAIAILLLAGTGTVGLIWLSCRLIVNPQAVTWVNEWLPGWSGDRRQDNHTQTLQEIRAELRQRGQLAGELLLLGKNQSFVDGKTPVTDILLPVLETSASCYANCDRLVELRIYQSAPALPKSISAEETYYQVQQFPVSGVEETFAIAPLVDATSSNQGSSRMLPLTHLNRFEDTGLKQGIWFNLSGHRVRGNETIAYGQVLYYHPQHQHLSVKLTWTSPTGEIPGWKEVTGGNMPELIVNQTIGMEPQFDVYQVRPQRFIQSPVQLEPISLAATASVNPQVESALLLARNRLWSTSLAWLKGVKQRSPHTWNAATQAQMDLIQWHAQATATQADGSWASPSQQVLANLLDGRWERAITVFASSVEASQETVGLLKTDQGRVKNRIEAALRVNPHKLEIKAWSALLMAAQQNPNAAIGWLQKQPQTKPQDITQIRALLQRLDPQFSDLQPAPTDRREPRPSSPIVPTASTSP